MDDDHSPDLHIGVQRTIHTAHGRPISTARQSPDDTSIALTDHQRIATARKCEEMAVRLADIAADIRATLGHHPGTANATGQVRFAMEFLREVAHMLSAELPKQDGR